MHGSNINVFLKDKSYFDDASLMLRSFFTGSKVVYRGEIESDPEFGSVMEKTSISTLSMIVCIATLMHFYLKMKKP